MRRNLELLLSVAGLILSQACADTSANASYLKRGAANFCDRALPLLVSVRTDGQYALNSLVMDSAQLVQALHLVLPPSATKLVMVRVDSSRAGQVRWIAASIERDGGEAYAPDTACFRLPPGAKRRVFPR
jgi:biopolymer transport protein ExbD